MAGGAEDKGVAAWTGIDGCGWAVVRPEDDIMLKASRKGVSVDSVARKGCHSHIQACTGNEEWGRIQNPRPGP